MKAFLKISCYIVGILFIFSGLIKANDPLGLSYKMQEFFEAWGWNYLRDYTLYFSVGMNVLEVAAGVALLLGWRMRFFSILLFLLVSFFTFLTAYVLFSGKIKACGCFGDCIPLTPQQTFTKDIILLVLVLFIMFKSHRIKQVFSSSISWSIFIVLSASTFVLQLYVLKHLPYMDCLPYKKGKNILEQKKIPAGSIGDSSIAVFKYKKNGKMIEFQDFPADFDSTYEYVDRIDKLIRKGNAEPKIVDFTLNTFSGGDTTEAIFQQKEKYILLFVQEFPNEKHWKEKIDENLWLQLHKAGFKIFIATSDVEGVEMVKKQDYITLLKCDATVVKTASRVNPTYYLMQGADILAKYSYADADQLLKLVGR